MHVQSKLLTHEKYMLRFLLGRGRGSVCVFHLLKSLIFISHFNEVQAIVYAVLFYTAGHQPAFIIQGERR